MEKFCVTSIDSDTFEKMNDQSLFVIFLLLHVSRQMFDTVCSATGLSYKELAQAMNDDDREEVVSHAKLLEFTEELVRSEMQRREKIKKGKQSKAVKEVH